MVSSYELGLCSALGTPRGALAKLVAAAYPSYFKGAFLYLRIGEARTFLAGDYRGLKLRSGTR